MKTKLHLQMCKISTYGYGGFALLNNMNYDIKEHDYYYVWDGKHTGTFLRYDPGANELIKIFNYSNLIINEDITLSHRKWIEIKGN